MSSSCCPSGVWFILGSVIPMRNQKSLQAQKFPQREKSFLVKIL